MRQPRIRVERRRAIACGCPGSAAEEREVAASAAARARLCGLDGSGPLMPGELPFGHQRMVELARAMALEPACCCWTSRPPDLNDTETESLATLILDIRARGRDDPARRARHPLGDGDRGHDRGHGPRGEDRRRARRTGARRSESGFRLSRRRGMSAPVLLRGRPFGRVWPHDVLHDVSLRYARVRSLRSSAPMVPAKARC